MAFTSLTAKNRFWIIGQHGTYLGEGRVALLQAIEEHGSISGAARSMHMSYLKAWKLVDSMNRFSPSPLVITSAGGKDGGGSVLTEEGKQVMRVYQKLNKQCQAFLNRELKKLSVKQKTTES